MDEAFIPCSARYLPVDANIEAARIAVLENPANRPPSEALALITGLTLGPDQLAVMTSKYWGKSGIKLSVGFPFDSTPLAVQKKIVEYGNLWNKYANILFMLTENHADADIRITRAGDGYWSYLGTDIKSIPRNEPTMCLQGFTLQTPAREWDRVPPHEFGHTCGFPHEHMRKRIIDRIDVNKAIQYFGQTQGWSPAMVRAQVLTPLAESSIMGSPDADETSIMAYSLPGFIMKDGVPVIGGSRIEEQDAETVGKLYPKDTTPPGPVQPPPGEHFDMRTSLDFERKLFQVSLPPGWKMNKMGATNGGVEMSKEKAKPVRAVTSAMAKYANELEALGIEDLAGLSEGKQAGLGGIVQKVLDLIQALKDRDYLAVAVAVRDILNVIIGDDGGISFQQQAEAAGFDWQKLVAIILKLLPLILDM